jgi:hypothetical protein
VGGFMGARNRFSKTQKISPKSGEMPVFTAYGKFNHQTVQETRPKPQAHS